MPPALLTHTSSAGGPSGINFAALDTRGASLLTITSSFSDVTALPTLTDSRGNTWTRLTYYETTVSLGVNIWYTPNPLTAATHTATISGSNLFSSGSFCAWTGTVLADVFDAQNGTSSGSSTVVSIQPGAITPSRAGCLLLAVMGQNGTVSGVSVDGGFVSIHSISFVGGSNYGHYTAYLIQGVPASINPLWAWTTAQLAATTIAVFRPSSSRIPFARRSARIWRRPA